MTKSKTELTKKTASIEAKDPNEAPRIPNVGEKMYRRSSPDDSARVD